MIIAAGAVGGRNRRVEYQDHLSSDTDTSSYTYNGVAFGTASARRTIIVAFQDSQGTAGAPDSMTIGGITASLELTGGSGARPMQFWVARVPTGTTGTIVVSRSAGTMVGSSINVYAAYDLTSDTPFATAAADGTTTLDLSLNAPGGGIVIGFGRAVNAASRTFTWSGLTEDQDGAGDTGNWVTTASASKVAAATPRAVSVTVSAGTCLGIAASWQ